MESPARKHLLAWEADVESFPDCKEKGNEISVFSRPIEIILELGGSFHNFEPNIRLLLGYINHQDTHDRCICRERYFHAAGVRYESGLNNELGRVFGRNSLIERYRFLVTYFIHLVHISLSVSLFGDPLLTRLDGFH